MMKFIGKYWKELSIALLLIAVILLSKGYARLQSDNQLLLNAKDSAFLQAKYYQNKNGELVGQVKTHEVTIDQLENYSEQLGLDKKRLEGKVGKLERLVAHWEGKASVRDTVTVNNIDTIFIDNSGHTITGKWFEWSNKYMFINGITTETTTSLTYKYDVDFSLTAFRKPQGFLGLGKSQLLTDIYFSDPGFRVKEFKGFVITEPKKGFFEKKGIQLITAGLIGVGLSEYLLHR